MFWCFKYYILKQQRHLCLQVATNHYKDVLKVESFGKEMPISHQRYPCQSITVKQCPLRFSSDIRRLFQSSVCCVMSRSRAWFPGPDSSLHGQSQIWWIRPLTRFALWHVDYRLCSVADATDCTGAIRFHEARFNRSEEEAATAEWEQ